MSGIVASQDVRDSGILADLHRLKGDEIPRRGGKRDDRHGVGGPTLWAVLLLLSTYTNRQRVAYVSVSKLSLRCGLSREAVSEALYALEQLGHIREVGRCKRDIVKWFIAAAYEPVDNSQPDAQPDAVPDAVPDAAPDAVRRHIQETRDKRGSAAPKGAAAALPPGGTPRPTPTDPEGSPSPAPKRGSSTPTPPPVDEVLADDPRQPGADGFGTLAARKDPRRTIAHRPPGWEAEQRARDEQRRDEVLAELLVMDTTPPPDSPPPVVVGATEGSNG